MINKNDLFELIEKENFIDYLRNADYSQLKEMFGKDFADMRGFSQNNPHHCYDLFEHTLRVVSNLNIDGLSRYEGLCLKTAALYHDVGKISTAIKKDWKTVFYGHASISEKIVMPVLEKMGFDSETAEYIGFFVKHHDDFINFRLPEEPEKSGFALEINQKNIIDYFKKLCIKSEKENKYIPQWKDILMLARLSLSDVSAQAETVYSKNKEIIDTRENKQNRQRLIYKTVKEAMEKSHI